MTWTALPSGESVPLSPGYFYAVVASVKASHDEAAIEQIASDHGLSVFDYAEQGQRPGLGPDPKTPDYRYVAVQAFSKGSGSIPWAVPWPASLFDSSSIVEAWVSPPGSALVLPPDPSPPRPLAPSFRLPYPRVGLGLALAAGLVIVWDRTRRRARRTANPCACL